MFNEQLDQQLEIDKLYFDNTPFLDKIFSNDLEKKCSTLPTNNETYDLVYSIGDIHGDYQAFNNIITQLTDKTDNKVILYNEDTQKYSWNPEVSNVCIVQTGDIIDGVRPLKEDTKNPEYYKRYNSDDLVIIDIMITLKKEAETSSKNNKIILLYGNHEIENIFNIIDIQEQNYNNFLVSSEGLSEIDYCTFNLKDEITKDDITEELIKKYNQYKKCVYDLNFVYNLKMFSIDFKKPIEVKTDILDDLKTNKDIIRYNMDLIKHRFNYLHKLKDYIICNYQTYAIVNSYLFCHSGFISYYVSKIINLYYKANTKSDKVITLKEFLSLVSSNQRFINILNKSISKIINFLCDVYTTEHEHFDDTTSENIKKYMDHIRDIIWSQGFRSSYSNYIKNDYTEKTTDVDLQYLTEGINFILHSLKLKGIIIGHIADEVIRKVRIYNNQIPDFSIYITDIMISRAFYGLELVNGERHYIYNKEYVILCIDNNEKILYKKIPHNFTSFVKNRELTDKTPYVEYRDENLYKSLYLDLNYNVLKQLIYNFIYYSDDIIVNNIDIVKQLIENKETKQVPEDVLTLIQDYIHVKFDEDNIKTFTNIRLLYNDLYDILINIFTDKIINYIKSYIKYNLIDNVFTINDLLWIIYTLTYKNNVLLNTEFSEDVMLIKTSNCVDYLLKLYYNSINSNNYNYEIFKVIYNENIPVINEQIFIFVSSLYNELLKDNYSSIISLYENPSDISSVISLCNTFYKNEHRIKKEYLVYLINNTFNINNLYTTFFDKSLISEEKTFYEFTVKIYMKNFYYSIIQKYLDKYYNSLINLINTYIINNENIQDKQFIVQKVKPFIIKILYNNQSNVIPFNIFFILNYNLENVNPNKIEYTEKLEELLYLYLFKKLNDNDYDYLLVDFKDTEDFETFEYFNNSSYETSEDDSFKEPEDLDDDNDDD